MPIVVTQKGSGEAIWMMGVLMEIKLASRDAGGALTVIEMTVPPGPVPTSPIHNHPGEETVYVLEGSVRYHVGDETVDLNAGSQLHIPRGTREWGENVTNRPLRMLAVYSGPAANIDQFFAEAGEPARSRTVPPPTAKAPDIARLAAIGRKYGIEIEATPPMRELEAHAG